MTRKLCVIWEIQKGKSDAHIHFKGLNHFQVPLLLMLLFGLNDVYAKSNREREKENEALLVPKTSSKLLPSYS